MKIVSIREKVTNRHSDPRTLSEKLKFFNTQLGNRKVAPSCHGIKVDVVR